MIWIQIGCKGYQQTTLFLSLFQVGKQFELLNCDKHKSIAKKFKRDIATCRPDITHQVIYTVDFPEPDLGPDIGPLQLKNEQKLPNMSYIVPNLLVMHFG